MRWKVFYLLLIGILDLSLVSSSCGETRFVQIRYQPDGIIPSLQKKVGLTLGLSPFKDKRPDQQHIGRYVNYQRILTYVECVPSPLEKAIRETLSKTLSRKGIRIVPVSRWDDKQEFLKSIEADSVLMIEIERFWTEGRTVARGTNVNTSIYLTIHLGLKKEGKVLTERAYASKDMILKRWIPGEVELTINQALTEIFDSFFSNLL
jgi:hypothetical protein